MENLNSRKFLMSGLTLLSLACLGFSREPGWWPTWGVIAVLAAVSFAIAGWDGIVKKRR